MLDIGKFDRMISIEYGETNTDTMGGETYEWTKSGNEWAFVEWKNAGSGDDQDKIQSTMSVEFTIRNNSAQQESITANKYRIGFPVISASSLDSSTQYYTVVGVKLWGGREKYKTLITELKTNEFPVV